MSPKVQPNVTQDLAKVGDLVVVAPHHVGAQDQVGEILEVLPGTRPHFRVRWDDGHESIFFPSSDATFKRASRPGRRS